MRSSTPWNHIVVDDFLDAEDFRFLSSLEKDHAAPDELVPAHNKVYADGKIEAVTLPREYLEKLQSRYHPQSMEFLQQLAPKKVPLYEYSEFEPNVAGSRYKSPIHDDQAKKILSIVVYLSPEKGSGTMLYSSKQDKDPVQVEWRQNRALIFSRLEKTTWHSFEGDGKSNRLALVYNLRTNDLKGVFEAEGGGYANYLYKSFLRSPRKTLLRAYRGKED